MKGQGTPQGKAIQLLFPILLCLVPSLNGSLLQAPHMGLGYLPYLTSLALVFEFLMIRSKNKSVDSSTTS